MTRRRRILLSAGIIAACIVATIGVLAMVPPRPGVSKTNFDRILKGMSRAEVEEILGKSPVAPARVEEGGDFLLCWANHFDGTFIGASFTNDGMALTGKEIKQPDTFAKLRRWLNLPK